MDIFRGSSQNWTIFRGHLCILAMHFRVFSEGRGTEWRTFWGCKNFKYSFEVLEIPDMFLMER